MAPNPPTFTPSSSGPTLRGATDDNDYNERAQKKEIDYASGNSKYNAAGEQEQAPEDLDTLEKQQTVVAAHHSSQFPDGGFQAWSCVVGGFACLFCSFGWINCIGIFQGYYETHQLASYSSSTVSWISSLETFCMFFFGPLVGKLYDAFGPRYVLLAGTFLHVFGLMMASISTKYWHFIICQGIVSSTGASMIFYPAISCVSTWFFKKRAFALGIMVSGSSLGGVILPIMIDRLIPRIGFGWAMRTTSFLILFMMIIANLTLRSRFPAKGWTPWKLNEFTKHFKEFGYVTIVIGSFFFFFGMFLPFNYIVLYGQRHGMSDTLANYLVSILNAASLFGRILPGWLGDKFGRFNMMMLISYASGILVLALWIPGTGHIPTIIFAAFYGFTTGAFVSLVPACLAQISDIREIGVRNGALFATVSLAALTGVPIGGALLTEYDGGFLGLQIFAGVCIIVGSTMFLVARGNLSGWRLMMVV
ncbi:hypothetical protein RUND412_007861 [Rhizina undulata]